MSKPSSYTSGFTLVEMIVVIPMIILIVAVMIGFMVALIGSAVGSAQKTNVIYNTQEALNQIERDTSLSQSFLTSYTPPSPQDINNTGTVAFTSANGNTTSIIFSSYSTTQNPMTAGREIVYYANQPHACTLDYKANTPFLHRIVYFVKNGTLYRRSIVPPNNQNATVDANTTCAKPWQRGSCAAGITGATCLTVDVPLVSSVSSLNLMYYKKSSPGVSVDPSLADSLQVTITTTTTVIGDPATYSLSVAASRLNNLSD